MVQISELYLRDAEGRTVFEDLNLRLARGEWAFIIGPAGSGKTELIKLICRELLPQRGQILVDGRNIVRLSPEKLRGLRRRLGVVLKGMPPIVRRTLVGNLIFKLRVLGFGRQDAELRARKSLALVGLEGSAERRPPELSMIEMRLFQLALALSHDPCLLLLDDPFAELELPERVRLLKVLEDLYLCGRLSLLVTAEDAELAERAPATILCLRDGRLQRLRSAPLEVIPRREGMAP
jgi:cell division transport system ATP-binding protein